MLSLGHPSPTTTAYRLERVTQSFQGPRTLCAESHSDVIRTTKAAEAGVP